MQPVRTIWEQTAESISARAAALCGVHCHGGRALHVDAQVACRPALRSKLAYGKETKDSPSCALTCPADSLSPSW